MTTKAKVKVNPRSEYYRVLPESTGKVTSAAHAIERCEYRTWLMEKATERAAGPGADVAGELGLIQFYAKWNRSDFATARRMIGV